MTALIIGIIGLAVAPFFLLSGAFGAPKRARKKDPDQTDGPMTPMPTDASGPFPGIGKKNTQDPDSDSGGDGGGDGGD